MAGDSSGRPSGYSLQVLRIQQLNQETGERISRIVGEARRATDIPQLEYHLRKHGAEFGATTAEEYVQAFREHLRRDDLRIFTFLDDASYGTVALWAFVAPDTGTTALYNEKRRQVRTFYRPWSPERRMANVRHLWVEVIGREGAWVFQEQWEW